MNKLTIAVLGMLMASPLALARGGGGGWMLGLSVAPESTTIETPAATSTDTANDITAKFGYTMGSGLYLGGVFNSLSSTSDDGTTSSSYPTASAMGIGLGYHSGGFFADLNYFVSSIYTRSSALEWNAGSGIGVDLGYNTMLSSNFYMGFQLGYKAPAFTKKTSSGADSDESNKIARMAPAINLGFVF